MGVLDAATFPEVVAQRAAREPDRRAFTFLGPGGEPEEELTYGALAARVAGVARALAAACRPGDRALLLYPPGLDFVAAFLGCLAAGVVAVPAYLPRGDRQLPRLGAIVADARPAVALTTAATLARSGEGLVALLRDAGVTPLPTDGLAGDQRPAVPADLAFLQYTSGSTGDPKGVRISHANLVHNSRLIHAAFGHGPDSVALLWAPPYHDMGLIGGILQPLWGGFPGVLMSPLAFLKRPLGWLRAIDRHGATTSGGPNFAYDLCLERLRPQDLDGLDLSRWRLAFNGAEPVRAETLERFAAAFAPAGFRREAFFPCYGLAEATLIVSGGPARLHGGFVGSGPVLEGQDVRIVDGEIQVRGPSVAAGYWGQPDLIDGWLHTGDLGFLADDGDLVVTGRLKDLIIVAGRNHYPQDLEATACRAHPAIRSGGAAAFAVSAAGTPDGVNVVIVLEVDRRPASWEAVLFAVRQAIGAEHDIQLASVLLIAPGTLPRTSSGKVRRGVCRSQWLAGNLDVFHGS